MKRLLAGVLLLCGCMGPPVSEADVEQQEQTQSMIEEAHRQVGMPDVINWTERRFAKQILELRDSEITTYTYIVDMSGQLHFVCESVGYGLPYSVQYTSPESPKKLVKGGERYVLPQPDPNGLFMPDGLSATWILCADGEGGVKPVYSEPALLVSPFQMH